MMDSRISRRRMLMASAAAAAAGFLPAAARAQWAPSRTVTIVVPYPAGGPTDNLARFVGREIQGELGQQVIIDNRPGGSGAIGSRAVAQGVADGHLLVLGNNQTHATNISLLPNGGGYDPVKDFAPIAGLADLQHILVVKNDLPVKTVAELLALAKAQPGKLNCGSTGQGSASHLTLELFKARAGVDITHVAYKGSAPLQQDLLGGHVDMSFATTPTVLSQVQAGKLRALAVASSNRSPHLPDLPTLAQAGVQGVEADAWLGFFAPAATPPDALKRLRDLTMKAMQNAELRAAIQQQGMAVNVREPAAFATFLQEDIRRWAEVIRRADVKAE